MMLVLSMLLTACTPSDTEETDTEATDTEDGWESPYECSELEASDDLVPAATDFAEWWCWWGKECLNPDLVMEECISDMVELCSDPASRDEWDWCALEECMASVPVGSTECPPEATDLWYMEDQACVDFWTPVRE